MCKDCEERRKMAREALLNRQFLDAAKHVAKGAVEKVGLKKKTGARERRIKSTKQE